MITEGITQWCDCSFISPADTTVARTPGSPDKLPTFHNTPACGGWIEFDPKVNNSRGLTSFKRPRDRGFLSRPVVRGLNPVLFNEYEKMVLQEADERQFNGFCTPCGGFRKHKRGCPSGLHQ